MIFSAEGSTPTIVVVVVGSLWVVMFFTAAHYLYRYVLNYRLTPSQIQVTLFGLLPIIGIEYSSIAEVREISNSEILSSPLLLFGALKAGNRMFGKGLLIRRSWGLFRMIVITPDDTKEFAGEVIRRSSGDKLNLIAAPVRSK